MSPTDLSGRVALVTGGARGIGRAIADLLAQHGASVVVTSRDPETAAAAAGEIQARGGEVLGFAHDVRDARQVAEIHKAVFTRFKRLDILVNNAGVLGDGLMGMVPESTIDETLAINVKGLVHHLQNAARLMRRGGGGSIVNIASIVGVRGNRGQVVYAASKAAVVGATLSAAKELASAGIRVNALAPGYINTGMIAHLGPAIHAERMNSIAMGRIGEAEDVAGAALFLASDLSRYVTGQVIGVDGGMLL